MESRKVKKIILYIFLAGLVVLIFGPIFGLYGFTAGIFIMLFVWFLGGTMLGFIYEAKGKEKGY